VLFLKDLGEYLEESRKANGISVEEAADDLKVTVDEIENIEAGNTRAFKDLYELRSLIKKYAKYLGLKPDKVNKEFNDFLFEHTSKISLDDIMEAMKKREQKEEENKIISPYTKEIKQKKDLAPVVLVITGILLLFVLIYILINLPSSKEDIRNNELQGSRMEEYYEFTN
jgi:cytoskeletal protein RodZ